MVTFVEVPGRVSQVFGGRPVRWVPARRLVGDFDGRHRTLEVFDAAPSEQLDLLYQLDDERPALEQLIGGPLIIVFHTPGETDRLYPEIRVAQLYHRLATLVDVWTRGRRADKPNYDPDHVGRILMEAA